MKSKLNQTLIEPENGWIRYDDTHTMFTYIGTVRENSSNAYNSTTMKFATNGAQVTFSFYGEGLRIIADTWASYRSNDIRVVIDDVEESFNIRTTATAETVKCVYEKLDLEKKNHNVKIYLPIASVSSNLYLDAIDVIDYKKKLAIKNSTTNKVYSLTDNTLIHLPSSSPKSMILHGIEQGKEIQLDIPFNKHNYVNESSVENLSGKVFTQDIGRVNTLNIKEVKEDDFEPIYTWYETNMTSNTAPSPLVASASSTVSATYPAYKAFNGTNSSNTDGWASNGVQANITINYGLKKKINIVRVSASMTSGGAIPLSAPKDFIIKGSEDGITFHDIVKIENQTNWTSAETRDFEFGIDTEYQIYMLDTLSNNGNSNTIIGEILYGYKRGVN